MIDGTIFRALFTYFTNLKHKFLCVPFFGSPSFCQKKRLVTALNAFVNQAIWQLCSKLVIFTDQKWERNDR